MLIEKIAFPDHVLRSRRNWTIATFVIYIFSVLDVIFPCDSAPHHVSCVLTTDSDASFTLVNPSNALTKYSLY